jgi:hypothetical protein
MEIKIFVNTGMKSSEKCMACKTVAGIYRAGFDVFFQAAKELNTKYKTLTFINTSEGCDVMCLDKYLGKIVPVYPPAGVETIQEAFAINI